MLPLVRASVSMMMGSAAENDLERIRLALTEACANVVRHAYPEDPGMLDIGLCMGPRTITVEVLDRGVGGAEQREPREAAAGGLGLPLIDMLADRVEISPQHPGTSVRMSFDLH